jgi:hypothetical protein
VLIDCSEATMGAGVEFWSRALGLNALPPDPPDSPYVGLEGDVGGLRVELQSVGAPSRFHLDIETDDVEAEVKRLEQLGARRKQRVQWWWVMEAPTGHLICVVPKTSEDSLAEANVWED